MQQGDKTFLCVFVCMPGQCLFSHSQTKRSSNANSQEMQFNFLSIKARDFANNLQLSNAGRANDDFDFLASPGLASAKALTTSSKGIRFRN